MQNVSAAVAYKDVKIKNTYLFLLSLVEVSGLCNSFVALNFPSLSVHKTSDIL